MTTVNQQLVAAAVRQFTPTFGLRAYPGSTFRLNEDASYVNSDGFVALVVDIRQGAEWVNFATDSITAIQREYLPTPPDVPRCDHEDRDGFAVRRCTHHAGHLGPHTFAAWAIAPDVVRVNPKAPIVPPDRLLDGPRCTSCDEDRATFRLSLTTMDGELLDTADLCRECARGGAALRDLVVVPRG